MPWLCRGVGGDGLETFFVSYAQRYCERVIAGRCDRAALGFNQGDCEWRVFEEFVRSTPKNASVNQAQATACLDWLTTDAVDTWDVQDNGLTPDSPCDLVIESPSFLKPSAPCTAAGQCEEPAAGDAACRDGKCTQLIPANTGETCHDYDPTLPGRGAKVCGVNDYCHRTTHKCVARAAQGQPCEHSGQCAPTLRCVGERCEAKLADGQPCAQHEQCASWLCESVCKVKGRAGDACTSPDQCGAACINGKCADPIGVWKQYCATRP